MRAGCDNARRVVARDPSATWRPLQIACLSARARLAMVGNSPVDALSLAAQAVASARNVHSADPIMDRYGVVAEQLLLGDIRRRTADETGAKAVWIEALVSLPSNTSERPSEMSERAELLRRLGRTGEAKPIIAKLAAIGFRQLN